MSQKRRRVAQRLDLDPQAPPAIRLANQSAQRATWRDPDDTTPNARRTAKEVTGFRAACALRRMLHHNAAHSQITEHHILAADLLRLQVDAVLIGFSGRRELLPIQSVMYGPLSGPSVAALRSIRAWQPLQRALALFTDDQRKLLTWVVLENRSVRSWCVERAIAAPPRVMRVLVDILDRLVEHYDVADDRPKGRWGERAA
jgi:hypothetical protein